MELGDNKYQDCDSKRQESEQASAEWDACHSSVIYTSWVTINTTTESNERTVNASDRTYFPTQVA